MEQSKISEYYSDQYILITGATGFMGKTLIEKLLRSCPKISTIYLLVRPKKGKQPQDRIENLINCPIFDKLRAQPNGDKLFNKIICISGDIARDNLDLSNDDEKELSDKVTTIFHMAANVRFDQQLKPAILLNTGGTLNLLNLACNFVNLKCFVHVSTSYCHCDETILEEKLYKAPHNPRKIIDLVKWMDDKLLGEITPKLLGNSPNTYAYSKALTETLIAEYSNKIPIIIARPSIVTATWKEPIPGWIDNLNGPTGLIVGAGKGVIRSMHCNPDYQADLVPVDNAINSLIIVGWKGGIREKTQGNQVDVYHITANKNNAISWGEALDLGRKHFYDNPFSVCLWYPSGSIKSSYMLHIIAVFLFHTIPAYFVDLIMILTRNKPFLVRTQKRINNGLQVLQYYTTRRWDFRNEIFMNLWYELNETDQKIFYTSALKINWDDYLLKYVLGARKYCIHEEPETIPYAKKVLRGLYYVHIMVHILLMVLVLWVFHNYGMGLLNQVEKSVLFLTERTLNLTINK